MNNEDTPPPGFWHYSGQSLIVPIAFLAILFAIAIPAFQKVRVRAKELHQRRAQTNIVVQADFQKGKQ